MARIRRIRLTTSAILGGLVDLPWGAPLPRG